MSKESQMESSISDGYKADRVNVAVPHNIKLEWQAMADEKGMSLSKFIRHAVTVYVTAMCSKK